MRLNLWADGYVMVKNDDGVEIPICDACHRKGCYKYPRVEGKRELDCKRMFKFPGKYSDHAQCCCYGHSEESYMHEPAAKYDEFGSVRE